MTLRAKATLNPEAMEMFTNALSILECSTLRPLGATIALSGLMDADPAHKTTGYLIFVTRADKMNVYRSNFPGIDSFI